MPTPATLPLRDVTEDTSTRRNGELLFCGAFEIRDGRIARWNDHYNAVQLFQE
jgi:limonene-1,2-epoxide hydrolase